MTKKNTLIYLLTLILFTYSRLEKKINMLSQQELGDREMDSEYSPYLMAAKTKVIAPFLGSPSVLLYYCIVL